MSYTVVQVRVSSDEAVHTDIHRPPVRGLGAECRAHRKPVRLRPAGAGDAAARAVIQVSTPRHGAPDKSPSISGVVCAGGGEGRSLPDGGVSRHECALSLPLRAWARVGGRSLKSVLPGQLVSAVRHGPHGGCDSAACHREVPPLGRRAPASAASRGRRTRRCMPCHRVSWSRSALPVPLRERTRVHRQAVGHPKSRAMLPSLRRIRAKKGAPEPCPSDPGTAVGLQAAAAKGGACAWPPSTTDCTKPGTGFVAGRGMTGKRMASACSRVRLGASVAETLGSNGRSRRCGNWRSRVEGDASQKRISASPIRYWTQLIRQGSDPARP